MKLSADDRLEILDLAARYCDAIDAGHYDEWIALFDPAGALEWPGGKAVGASALKQFTIDHQADPNRGGAPNARHWTANHVVRTDGEEVRMTSYFYVTVNKSFGSDARIVATGTYRDTLTRSAKGWRFKVREIEFDT
jgi:3-phenylpropionate/cinnamic acid dioxygenase small subunit